MFHKVKDVTPLPDFMLSVQFCEGVSKIYDVTPLISKWDMFKVLNDKPEIFGIVEVDVGGYGIIWDDDLNISRNELWANGVAVETPFDGLMAFSDATAL